MKAFCKTCTLHFVDEFEVTMKPPCNYWGDLGLTNLQSDLKKKVWDWLFLMPTDEISILANLSLGISIKAVPILDEDRFEMRIPGYKDWSDDKRKRFQKLFFISKAEGKVFDFKKFEEEEEALKIN
jgi:hypothetical protein